MGFGDLKVCRRLAVWLVVFPYCVVAPNVRMMMSAAAPRKYLPSDFHDRLRLGVERRLGSVWKGALISVLLGRSSSNTGGFGDASSLTTKEGGSGVSLSVPAGDGMSVGVETFTVACSSWSLGVVN